MLDIDVYQRLTTMSDGQRRRVQICMGLLKPYDVSWWQAYDTGKAPTREGMMQRRQA